jgi:hypothetical protein
MPTLELFREPKMLININLSGSFESVVDTDNFVIRFAQFFAAWVVIMTLFTIFFLPETKGVPMVCHIAFPLCQPHVLQ